MTGETLSWIRLCFRLKKTPQELRRSITSSEFLLLQAYLEREWNERTKQDWYLAQIAATIERIIEGLSNDPQEVQVKDKLLDFSIKEIASDGREEEEEEEKKEGPEMDFDKMVWLSRLGITEPLL